MTEPAPVPAPKPGKAAPRALLRAAIATLLLLGVLAGGAALRFHAIGAKSLWLDETASLEIAEYDFVHLLGEVAQRDTHPPLYYVALRAWLGGSTSAARARALSAAAGVATLAVFYALARGVLARAASLVATGLLAASAFQVYFAQEARHYVLATFLVTLSWYLLVRIVARGQGGRWPLWLGLALTNTAALYTYYYAAFAIAGQFVVLVVLWRGAGRRLAARWCVWQLVPAALFALYLPVIRDRLESLRRHVGPGTYEVGAEGLWRTASQFACGFAARQQRLTFASEAAREMAPTARDVGAGLAVAALVVGLAGARRRPRAAAVGAVWLLGPMAVVCFFPFKGHVYEPKHILFAAPALALLPAVGLSGLKGVLKAAPVLLVALLLAANALSLFGGELLSRVGAAGDRLVGYFDRRVEKENWRDAFSRLSQEAEPNDILVLNPRYLYLPYRYYYDPTHTGLQVPPLLVREAPLAGPPFRRGELAMERRIWVIDAASNVAQRNPAVDDALAPYPQRFHEEYHDLVGSIRLVLYDTRQGRRGEGGARAP
jgi:hypothetical protein